MFDRFDHWYDSTLFGEKIKKVARNLSTFIPFAFIYRVYMGSIETQIYRVSYTSTCDQVFFRCSNVGTRGKGLWKLVRRPRYDYFRQALRIAWQWPKDSLHCLVAWVTCIRAAQTNFQLMQLAILQPGIRKRAPRAQIRISVTRSGSFPLCIPYSSK